MFSCAFTYGEAHFAPPELSKVLRPTIYKYSIPTGLG